jgi:hypothetical protein
MPSSKIYRTITSRHGRTSMTDFGILIKVISMAQQYNTVEFTEWSDNTLHVYFANGESWHMEFRED